MLIIYQIFVLQFTVFEYFRKQRSKTIFAAISRRKKETNYKHFTFYTKEVTLIALQNLVSTEWWSISTFKFEIGS